MYYGQTRERKVAEQQDQVLIQVISGTDTGGIWYWYLGRDEEEGEYISRPGTGQIYCVVL